MEIVHRLDGEIRSQPFGGDTGGSAAAVLERYRELARGYARVENAVAVLSDMRAGTSLICYGGFAGRLGMSGAVGTERSIGSIWEEEILRRIHPDDLHGKYLQELRFFHFMKRRPAAERPRYCLFNGLRMKDAAGTYFPALHRLFYASDPCGSSLWLALCLYQPSVAALPVRDAAVDTVTGHVVDLERHGAAEILSEREREVLALIERGMMSRDIAGRLSISVHTVSRHRQNILEKLQVRNSVEACRIARDLGLLR